MKIVKWSARGFRTCAGGIPAASVGARVLLRDGARRSMKSLSEQVARTLCDLAPQQMIVSSRKRRRHGLPSHMGGRARHRSWRSVGQRVGRRRRFALPLNVNTPTGVTYRSGATFLQPTAIILPRILEFSVAYRF